MSANTHTFYLFCFQTMALIEHWRLSIEKSNDHFGQYKTREIRPVKSRNVALANLVGKTQKFQRSLKRKSRRKCKSWILNIRTHFGEIKIGLECSKSHASMRFHSLDVNKLLCANRMTFMRNLLNDSRSQVVLYFKRSLNKWPPKKWFQRHFENVRFR